MSPAPGLSDAALLERLVAFDTTSRLSNLPLADFVCRLPRPPGGPDRADARRRTGPRPTSSSGRARTPEDGEGLTLSGHMDVVPADEPEWRSRPVRAHQGRGDLRGPRRGRHEGVPRARDQPAGARWSRLACAARWPCCSPTTRRSAPSAPGASPRRSDASPALPRDVVIGEPTSLRVVRLHKGMIRLQLAFRGRARTAAIPHLGRNAIEPAARAIGALAELRASWRRERPAHGEHFPEVPYAALNVGVVSGGSAANVIPDRCTVQLGIRLAAGHEGRGRWPSGCARPWPTALPGEPFELDVARREPGDDARRGGRAPPRALRTGRAARHRERRLRHRRRLAPDARAPLRDLRAREHRGRPPAQRVPADRGVRAGRELLDDIIRRRCLAA